MTSRTESALDSRQLGSVQLPTALQAHVRCNQFRVQRYDLARLGLALGNPFFQCGARAELAVIDYRGIGADMMAADIRAYLRSHAD